MSPRKRVRRTRRGVSAGLRKPIAPPTKVEEAPTKYRRARERERLRRARELEPSR
jgi:hypothetical protein